jgi:VWFA-related protein
MRKAHGRLGPQARSVAIATVLAVAAGDLFATRAPQAPPRATDLVVLDVHVVNPQGQPVPGLAADRFEVSINGRRRRVVSADFRAAPDAFAEGRLYVLAFDAASFQPGSLDEAVAATRALVQKLGPADLVGIAAYPSGRRLDPTSDRPAILRALDAVDGIGERPPTNRYGLALSDIVDLNLIPVQVEDSAAQLRAQFPAQARRIDEICTAVSDESSCRSRIVAEAKSLALAEEGRAMERVLALRALLRSLPAGSRRTNVVLVSAGLFAADRPGARPDLGNLAAVLGHDAAEANVAIYPLHVPGPMPPPGDAQGARVTGSAQRDAAMLSRTLSEIAASSGGTLAGSGTGGPSGFDRVLAETSSYYVLRVEPGADDRDGRPRRVSVKVSSGERGTATRARSWVVVPRPGEGPRTATPPPEPGTRPRLATVAPTSADVAAWNRLWGGSPATPPASSPIRAGPATPPAPTAIDDLYSAYASGETALVSERLSTRDDFERHRPDLFAALARWKKDWSPRRAVFALEIAISAYARGWPDPRRFLAAARELVTARPDPPGTRPDDDRFELLFHRTAVALLAAAGEPAEIEDYFTAVSSRVAADGSPTGAVRLEDSRLTLARAMALDLQAELEAPARARASDHLRAWMIPADAGDVRRRLSELVSVFAAAGAHADSRVEASVRQAFVLHRLGAHADAHALLETLAPSGDATVDYWLALVRGKVLVGLNRLDDAASAYEAAAALAPGAQTPAVAMAAVRLRLGDREEALKWAALARSTPQDRNDPWTEYWAGDTRFLPVWLSALRGARP